MFVDKYINIQDISGFTKLMRAILKEEVNTIKGLLKQPFININIQDNANRTAMLYAIRYENDEIINLIQNHIKNKALMKLKKPLMKYYWIMREQIEKERMHPNSPYLLNLVNNFD